MCRGTLPIMLAFHAAAAAPPDGACRSIDPELMHCPAPAMPRITGLREGAVTLELQVGLDGAVRASRVVEESGHAAWPAAARTAVARWRYAPSQSSRVRRVPFEFKPDQP